jgi:hypothetical protein
VPRRTEARPRVRVRWRTLHRRVGTDRRRAPPERGGSTWVRPGAAIQHGPRARAASAALLASSPRGSTRPSWSRARARGPRAPLARRPRTT